MTSSTYFFCPYCGSALGNYIEDNKKRLICERGHVVYENSKPAVGAIITDGGSRVLLTRRANAPYIGHWDIPGGFLEAGEHPEDGIKREIKEELGISIRIEGFLDHFISRYGENGSYVLNIFYVATADVTGAIAQDDVSEFKWFDLENLPDNLAFPVNKVALKLWRKRYQRG